MSKYEYRCRKCDYLFDDLMSPVVDVLECPICGSDTMWVMSDRDKGNDKVAKKTPVLEHSISPPEFTGALSDIE